GHGVRAQDRESDGRDRGAAVRERRVGDRRVDPGGGVRRPTRSGSADHRRARADPACAPADGGAAPTGGARRASGAGLDLPLALERGGVAVATGTSVREQYELDGFITTDRLMEAELIEETIPHMDAVIAADYETGIAPHMRKWDPGDDEARLRKIDQPQLSDRTIQRLIASPSIGRAAAELTGASMVQVWGVQLLYKPAGGGAAGNVGWHQDQQYWLRWWTPDSEIFTCWLALSEVTEEAGAMRFVPGSHRSVLLADRGSYQRW